MPQGPGLQYLRLSRGEWRKREAGDESEPDHPHRHLGGWRLAGSLAERRDAHQHGAAHEKAGQSSSSERLITVPHVQVIHTRSPSTALARSPQPTRRD